MIGSLTTWPVPPLTASAASAELLTDRLVPTSIVWAYLELARPAMLWWAIGAIVPWLLWWRRPESSTSVSWGAMQFLQQDAPLIAARDRHRQWYLLALRTAALLLIPLAMAQPTWFSGKPTPAPPNTADAHWIFVLDGSASMQSNGVTGTRWQAAQRYVAARLDQLPPGAAVSVAIVSDVCRVLTERPSGNRAEVRRAIESAEVSYATADWKELYPKLEQLIRDHSVDFPRQHVEIVSDLQATSWRQWQEPDSLQALRQQLGQQLTWELSVVEGSPGPNLSLVELTVDQPVTAIGRVIRGTVAVQNWDSLPQSTTITLTLQGTPVGQYPVDVPGRSREMVKVEFTANRPGLLELSAELSADAQMADNAINFPLRIDTAFPVVLVKESSAENDALPVVFSSNQDGEYKFDYRPRRPSQLTIPDWQAAPVLAVDRISGWSAAEREAVSGYVAQGGALVMFLGPETSAETINGWRVGAEPLFPCRLLEPTPRGSYRWALSDPDQRWALDRVFAAHPESGFLRTPIWQYWQLDCPRDIAGSSNWLKYADGSPAAVAHQVGAGMTLVFTTSPSLMTDNGQLPWSAAGTWPGLVPLVHEAIFQAAGYRQQPHTVASGIRWSTTLSATKSGATAARNVLNAVGSTSPGATVWYPLRSDAPTFQDRKPIATPDRPGCYVPETPGRTPQPRDVLRLAFPSDESDLQQLQAELLPMFQVSVTQSAADPAATTRRPRSGGHSLAGLAVLLAAIVLAIESYGSRNAWT